MLKQNNKNKNKTLTITMVGIVAAFSSVIYMFFPEIPIVPGVSYLKIDFSDFPALLLGVVMGPVEGLAVGVIKNIVHLARTTTFGIGEIMNVGIIAAMIFSLNGFSKLFSKLFKKDRLAPIPYFSAAAVTIVVTILSGWVLNGIFTPIFFAISGIPITSASVFAGVWGSTLLNTVKGALNVLPFYPVYRIANKTYAGLIR